MGKHKKLILGFLAGAVFASTVGAGIIATMKDKVQGSAE